MTTEYMMYALIAVGVATAYMALVNLVRKKRADARLHAVGGVMIGENDAAPPFADFCEKLLGTFGIEVRGQKELSLTLSQAGINAPYAVNYVLFIRYVVQPALFGMGLLVFIVLFSSPVDTPLVMRLFQLIVALVLLSLGLFGSKLYVANAKQRRQQRLLYSFPEALDLLLVCIESGLGLDAALNRVCNELRRVHPDMTYEMERTQVELTVLNDRVQALQNLSDRTEIVPFKALVSALIQTERFGTSLLDTLRVLSEDQRVTRLLNAENRAARIPVLITIPLIFCMLPSFIMIILGPPIVKVIAQGGIFGSAIK